MVLQRRLTVHTIGLVVPLVEAFVPNHEAHSVTKVEQLRSRRIVTGAYRIDSHVMHDFQLALHRSRIKSGTKGTLIVMQANAVQLHPPPVQMKPIVGREFEIAETKF